MPNWVTNTVTFNGDKEEIKRLKETVKSTNKNDESDFDFNKIIPMPEGLHVTSGSMENTAKEIIYKIEHDPLGEILEDKLDRLLDKIKWPEWIEDIPAQKAEIKQYIKNHKETGYTSWYHWCCDKWGTKWNAAEASWSAKEVTFQTAWSSPMPVLRKLSKMFPTLTISVSYADEDLGANCGRYDLKGGKIVDKYSPADETEALKHACDVWGYDYDEILEERNQDSE